MHETCVKTTQPEDKRKQPAKLDVLDVKLETNVTDFLGAITATTSCCWAIVDTHCMAATQRIVK